MNGFKAYQQMENLSQFILEVKNAKGPFKVGTEYYDDQLGRLEKKWDVISKEEFYSNIFDFLLNEIADFQDVLYSDYKNDFVKTILKYAGENDNYVLLNPECNVGFDLSSVHIQRNLLKWTQDEQVAKLFYLEHYKGKELNIVLKELDLRIDQFEEYQQLNDRGINVLSELWGVENSINTQLRIEKTCLEFDDVRGDF
ncbi:hypothetical protein SD231_000943 [Listeria monocytogenes]|nr:hypothetical protein [Listeria monocytogenes]